MCRSRVFLPRPTVLVFTSLAGFREAGACRPLLWQVIRQRGVRSLAPPSAVLSVYVEAVVFHMPVVVARGLPFRDPVRPFGAKRHVCPAVA